MMIWLERWKLELFHWIDTASLFPLLLVWFGFQALVAAAVAFIAGSTSVAILTGTGYIIPTVFKWAAAGVILMTLF